MDVSTRILDSFETLHKDGKKRLFELFWNEGWHVGCWKEIKSWTEGDEIVTDWEPLWTKSTVPDVMFPAINNPLDERTARREFEKLR